MAFQVGAARKKYKVFYPTLYASESENKDAKLFNCVQRGHQNSLEQMPMFFLMTSLGGHQHPIIATAFGILYTMIRFFYFKGYSTGIPDNRLTIGWMSCKIPEDEQKSLAEELRLVMEYQKISMEDVNGGSEAMTVD